MAGITNHPFRLICREMGAGLVVTELLSSHAIHYKNAKTFGMFDWTDSERPVSVQLFGGDPGLMAEAASVAEEFGADILDLNMGCWVPKVANLRNRWYYCTLQAAIIIVAEQERMSKAVPVLDLAPARKARQSDPEYVSLCLRVSYTRCSDLLLGLSRCS